MLALVVSLLFGIGVAGAANYQIVLSEALLSVHAEETQSAPSIARAGLRSYIGKQIGVHEGTVTYSIDGADAVVTGRVVSEIDDFETLYLLESEGVYTDPTFTGSSARRTVYQYAVKREIALDHVTAVTQVTGNLYVRSNAHVDGDDGASSGSPIAGNPDTVSLGSAAAALDAIGINWAVLTDTDFPVDYEDTWPSCALPADWFTVTRFNGDMSAPSSVCARGVLIVKGNFLPADGFQWDGIVLAGYIVYTCNNYRVDGIVVGGLDGNGIAIAYTSDTYLDYHRCYAFEAGKRLSHFEPVGGTWREAQ